MHSEYMNPLMKGEAVLRSDAVKNRVLGLLNSPADAQEFPGNYAEAAEKPSWSQGDRDQAEAGATGITNYG
jgi:hypothetical protein